MSDDHRPFEGWPRSSIERMLKKWEAACEDLRAIRRAKVKRASALESRLDRRVARIERSMMNMLYRETFGTRSGVPKKPVPVTPRA